MERTASESFARCNDTCKYKTIIEDPPSSKVAILDDGDTVAAFSQATPQATSDVRDRSSSKVAILDDGDTAAAFL